MRSRTGGASIFAFDSTGRWRETSAIDTETLYKGFRDPSADYSISPYWFWNGTITEAESRRQIGEMVRQGVRAAVLFPWAGLQPGYLTEEYWRQVGAALDAAAEAGLTLNFADEWLWSSGQAWVYTSPEREPSRVLQLHPEYRMKRLTCRRGQPGDPGLARAELGGAEVVVAARAGADGAMDEASLTLVPSGAAASSWTPPGPGWTLHAYFLVPWTERSVRTDLMNPDAARAYIDLAYEPFAKRFPKHLGTTIRWFVTDHEGSYGAPLPHTPALWEEFRQRHGYDLRPFLPLAEAAGPRAEKVRQDYFDTVSELYARSFVGQVTAWCDAHGVGHGHSDIEESIRFQVMWTGDMFRLWRASSIVYFDALIERGRMPVDFHEAASVARFEGKPLMVENQGLTGMDSYWSLEKARLGTNMCLLWGVHRLMPHYFEYDPAHVQYPPSWFLAQPSWPWFHHYADAARRGLYMNAQGPVGASLILYHPLESAHASAGSLLSETNRPVFPWNSLMDQTQEYYSALMLQIPREGWSFHIMDAHYMARASAEGGLLELAGGRYPVLILPPMSHLASSSAEKIARFAAGGGQVFALGPQPAVLDAVPMRRFPIREHPFFMHDLDYTRRIIVPDSVMVDLAPLFAAIRHVNPPEVEIVAGERHDLYFARRSQGEAVWYWCVNDSGVPRRVTARFPAGGVFEKWDAETGARATLPSAGAEVPLDFGPFDAFYVVRHAGPALAPMLPSGPRRTLLDLPRKGWQFEPESIVRVPYAQVEGEIEPLWLAPERLANRRWWLAGPYPDADGQGLFDPFPPEVEGFKPGDPAWTWRESGEPSVEPLKLVFGEQLDFHLWVNPHPERTGVYYAYVDVWSPEERDAVAAVAAAESMRLWWNGSLKLTERPHYPFAYLRDCWCYRVPIRIRQGWNSVLLKVGPSAAGPTGFLFRIHGPGNATLRDLVYAPSRDLPPQTPPRAVRLAVPAPPGTSGRPIRIETTDHALPETPFEFPPHKSEISLASWTDSTLAHYSGAAVYERSFTLEEVPGGGRIILDLGEVGLAATVWLNGSKAGERAWRPFELDVTGFVRRGENSLKIRVANSDAGWMAQGPTVYRRDAFWSTDFATERDRLQTLRPNGLEGPVRLLFERTES